MRKTAAYIRNSLSQFQNFGAHTGVKKGQNGLLRAGHWTGGTVRGSRTLAQKDSVYSMNGFNVQHIKPRCAIQTSPDACLLKFINKAGDQGLFWSNHHESDLLLVAPINHLKPPKAV
jgi:hypothetical protein